MESTCGFSIAPHSRSVGSRWNAEWIDATTQSRSASTSSGTSSEPSARMLTSTPFSSRNGRELLVDGIDLPVLRLHPALPQVVRVVGDREVLVAALDRRERHLLDGVVPVRRPRRVRVQIALELSQLDELRQRPVARRLQLAGVLAQLRRDELVAEELVQLLLVPVRDRLAGLGRRGRRTRRSRARAAAPPPAWRCCGSSSP